MFAIGTDLYIGAACQPFTVPRAICPGDSPQLRCTVEDISGVGVTFGQSQ